MSSSGWRADDLYEQKESEIRNKPKDTWTDSEKAFIESCDNDDTLSDTAAEWIFQITFWWVVLGPIVLFIKYLLE